METRSYWHRSLKKQHWFSQQTVCHTMSFEVNSPLLLQKALPWCVSVTLGSALLVAELGWETLYVYTEKHHQQSYPPSRTYLTSNLSRSAMKIPGMTISPRPNIAKLLAFKPCSNRSWGNTTETIHIHCVHVLYIVCKVCKLRILTNQWLQQEFLNTCSGKTSSVNFSFTLMTDSTTVNWFFWQGYNCC